MYSISYIASVTCVVVAVIVVAKPFGCCSKGFGSCSKALWML